MIGEANRIEHFHWGPTDNRVNNHTGDAKARKHAQQWMKMD